MKLTGIQVLRAFAALLVVVWHIGGIAKNFPDVQVTPPAFLQFGYAGVDLFFTISGFIICYISLKGTFDWRDFAMRRFFRIWPFYALFTAVAVVALSINPAWTLAAPPQNATTIVESFLVWPQPQYPALFVGWSLEHEIQFYVLAAILFSFGFARLLPGLLFAMFAAGTMLNFYADRPVWDWHLVSGYHLEFACGVMIYFWRARLRALGIGIPALLGGALLAATAWATETRGLAHLVGVHEFAITELARIVGYATASSLLLIAGLNVDRLRAPAGLFAPLLILAVLIGDASFTLYLSHPFVLSLLGHFGSAIGLHGFAAYLLLLSAVPLSCVFAVSFYVVLERPALALFTRAMEGGQHAITQRVP
jgi:peptidoglycan/LPS O-acetylase OafA/YrhL